MGKTPRSGLMSVLLHPLWLPLALVAGCGSSNPGSSDSSGGEAVVDPALDAEEHAEDGAGNDSASESDDDGGDAVFDTGGEDPPQPAAVTVLASDCASGAGIFAGATCQTLLVHAGDNPPLVAELRVALPDPALAIQGTVVLGSGGSGTWFFDDLVGGDVLVADFLALGYRVITRRWAAPWTYANGGVRAASQRYAELLRFIRSDLHTTGPLCAVGNSGGASEIAYGLSTWELDDVLDLAVLTGGPGLARIDYQCFPPTPEWDAHCPAFAQAGELECAAPACSAEQDSSVCAFFPAASAPADLHRDSVLHPEARLDYGDTSVHVLVGANDCTVSTAQAVLYREALAGPGVLEIVPAGFHALHTTEEGRAAIVAAVLGAALGPDG